MRQLPRALAAAFVIATTLLAFGAASASASSMLTVSVISPRPVPAGFETTLTVRAEGDQPELADLDYVVSGGELLGVVSLNAVEPGVAEGNVHVRRETPGEVTLVVKSGGATVASGTAKFASYGQIEVSATLAADAHASARTWRFEVVNDSGAVIETLSLGTSGGTPTGTAASSWLPYGVYTVRQVLGNDTRTSCSAGAFYAVASPAGGAANLQLSARSVSAAFTIAPCESAPTSLGVNVPIDVIDTFVPIDEVLGARQAGAPLPPATGTGLAPDAGSTTPWMLAAALAMVVASMGTISLVAARKAKN